MAADLAVKKYKAIAVGTKEAYDQASSAIDQGKPLSLIHFPFTEIHSHRIFQR